jgi:hypothetical protein
MQKQMVLSTLNCKVVPLLLFLMLRLLLLLMLQLLRVLLLPLLLLMLLLLLVCSPLPSRLWVRGAAL